MGDGGGSGAGRGKEEAKAQRRNEEQKETIKTINNDATRGRCREGYRAGKTRSY